MNRKEMAVLNWRFRRIKWNGDMSKVGWVTRLALLAALTLLWFVWVELPKEFAIRHTVLVGFWYGQWAVLTSYYVIILYYRYDKWYNDDNPRTYPLYSLVHDKWGWLKHHVLPIPFGRTYPNNKAKKAYYWYLALIGEWGIIFVSSELATWLQANRGKHSPPPGAFEVWLNENCMYGVYGLLGLLGLFLLYALVDRWLRRTYDLPHEKKICQLHTDYEKRIENFKAAILERDAMIGALKQDNKGWQENTHYVGEMVALAIALIRNVPAKRGDGDIGEAKLILTHVLQLHLLRNTESRQAALYRAGEEIRRTDRVRFKYQMGDRQPDTNTDDTEH